ncbi:hypothetical protein BX666DRAFT_2029062 [Dichotomocladium elegans]|nr:hypothetical protein BX666DRAFT_2029062 [Dichotomocladium elegans]
MSTYTLSKLSNEAYDVYMDQRLSRLEHQADMIGRLAAEKFSQRMGDPYHDHTTTRRSRSNRPTRPVSTVDLDVHRRTPHYQENIPVRRRRSSDNIRLHQGRRQRHPPLAEADYHYYDEPEIARDRRQWLQDRHNLRPRPSSVGGYSTGYSDSKGGADGYDYVEENSDYGDDADDDEEDSVMRERAIITRRNTWRNKSIPAQITDMPLDHYEIQPVKPLINPAPLVKSSLRMKQPQHREMMQSELVPGQQQPGGQPHYQSPEQSRRVVEAIEENHSGSSTVTPTLSADSASSSTGTASPVKKKKWPWSLFNITAAAIPRSSKPDQPQQKQVSPMPMATMSTPVQHSRRSIWTVNVTGPRDETLSPEQQEEIARQLPRASFAATTQKEHTGDFAKTAELRNIWVFRAESTAPAGHPGANMWIAFDYENQKRLTEHYYRHSEAARFQPANDGGIELFDSHIRSGFLPVFVFPFRQEAFYATTITGEQILRLQVEWIPNSKSVTFVDRRPPC